MRGDTVGICVRLPPKTAPEHTRLTTGGEGLRQLLPGPEVMWDKSSPWQERSRVAAPAPMFTASRSTSAGEAPVRTVARRS